MTTKPQGIVALIMAILGVLNFALSSVGVSPIPVDAESVSLFVTMVFTVVGIIGTVWNNFNMTDAAKLGDKLIDNIKSGDIDYVLADTLIRDLIAATKDVKEVEAE